MRVEQAPFALTLVLISACVAAPTAAGTQTVVEGSSKRVTVPCTDRVRVSGLKNEVTLTGACPDVTVDGSSNTVYIASLGRLSLAGSNNRVIWSDGIGGRAPAIDKGGTGNFVERKAGMTSRLEAPLPASSQAGNAGTAVSVAKDRAVITTPGVTVDARKDGAAAGASGRSSGTSGARSSGAATASTQEVAVLLFADNREQRTMPCEGRAVEVTGNRNELTLTGACASVRVSGNRNLITVDAVSRIATPGNENTVVYRDHIDDRAPRVSNTGKENRIRRAKP